MGYKYVFLIGQGIDQMGKMSKKHDWKNIQKRTKKECMPFCHNPRSYILEVVSTIRSRTTREEKASGVTTWGHEKKGYFEGKVYQKQKASKPYIYFS